MKLNILQISEFILVGLFRWKNRVNDKHTKYGIIASLYLPAFLHTWDFIFCSRVHARMSIITFFPMSEVHFVFLKLFIIIFSLKNSSKGVKFRLPANNLAFFAHFYQKKKGLFSTITFI